MPVTNFDPPRLGYSIKEACQVTSLSRSKIYLLLAEKRLQSTRIGGRTIIPAPSLQALIAGEA